MRSRHFSKWLNKLSAVFLVAMLALLSISCDGSTPGPGPGPGPGPEPSPYGTTNLVNNAGLERADAATFEAFGANLFLPTTAEAHSGTTAAVSEANDNERYMFSGVNAVFDYQAAVQASVYVKLANPDDANRVQFVVERKPVAGDVEVFSAQPEAIEGWQKVEVEIEEAEAAVQEFVVKVVVASKGEAPAACDTVYVDDFALFTADPAPINYIRNSGFEVDTAWGDYGAWVVDAAGRSGKAGKVDSSLGGPHPYQASGWMGVSAPIYDGSQTMVFSVYVKPEGDVTGSIRLRVERKEGLISPEQEFEILAGSDWTKISMDVPALDVSETLGEALYHIEAGAGFTGIVYVDDVELIVK